MKVKSKGETVELVQSVNSTPAMRGTEVMEMTQKTLTNNTSIGFSEDLEDSFDKTGVLEEEVEINPLKRQEMYNKNSVPNVFLIEEETNKKHLIRKKKYIIGRSKECDLNINNTIVSKRHAEIVYENNEFYVKDLKSSNFTYLNKAKIEPMELYKIEDGSRISFGNIWFIFKTNS